jgi:hypothetical protein
MPIRLDAGIRRLALVGGLAATVAAAVGGFVASSHLEEVLFFLVLSVFCGFIAWAFIRLIGWVIRGFIEPTQD